MGEAWLAVILANARAANMATWERLGVGASDMSNRCMSGIFATDSCGGLHIVYHMYYNDFLAVVSSKPQRKCIIWPTKCNIWASFFGDMIQISLFLSNPIVS